MTIHHRPQQRLHNTLLDTLLIRDHIMVRHLFFNNYQTKSTCILTSPRLINHCYGVRDRYYNYFFFFFSKFLFPHLMHVLVFTRSLLIFFFFSIQLPFPMDFIILTMKFDFEIDWVLNILIEWNRIKSVTLENLFILLLLLMILHECFTGIHFNIIALWFHINIYIFFSILKLHCMLCLILPATKEIETLCHLKFRLYLLFICYFFSSFIYIVYRV